MIQRAGIEKEGRFTDSFGNTASRLGFGVPLPARVLLTRVPFPPEAERQREIRAGDYDKGDTLAKGITYLIQEIGRAIKFEPLPSSRELSVPSSAGKQRFIARHIY